MVKIAEHFQSTKLPEPSQRPDIDKEDETSAVPY
jgi:hypothetical protein